MYPPSFTTSSIPEAKGTAASQPRWVSWHPVFDPQRSARPADHIPFTVPYKRILNGGNDIEYFDTIQAGEVLTVTSQVTDLQEREGRLGPMLMITSQFTYRGEGQVVAIARGTLIYY